jgi:hypothetical protein
MQEEGLRRQIMGVISHVLSDEGTDMDVRMALLRHLGENPYRLPFLRDPLPRPLSGLGA